MTKQQTLELLEKQMPLHHMYPIFYSMDTVIELIKGIEVGSIIDVEDLYSLIKHLIKDNIEEMDSEDAVDFISAEFSLNYNEISLDDVKIDFEEVGSRACYGLTDLIEGYIESMNPPAVVEEAQV